MKRCPAGYLPFLCSCTCGEAHASFWAGAADGAVQTHVVPSATGSVGAAYDVTSLTSPPAVLNTPPGAFSAAETSIAAPSLPNSIGART